MKFQLVVTALLVVCMLALSLAAPLREEGEARAVLQAIRMLLASANHGRGELQAENVTSAPANQPTNAADECEQVEDSNKVECGYYGITQTECEDKNCCWRESDVSGVPYCFYKIDTTPKCLTDDRVECGYYGIDGVECEITRGCCYSPTTVSGQPWCYHPKATEPQCQTDPANRVECGYLGITGEQCKGHGCCWSPTSVSGAPWCFTKSSTAAAKFAYFGNQQFRFPRPGHG